MRDNTAGFTRYISRRERTGIWATLGLAAAIGWTQLFAETRMPEGMHTSLFLLMWFWMVGAMMLPALAPVVTAGAELLHHVPAVTRLLHLALFLLAYLGLWSVSGVAALAVSLLSTDRPLLIASLVALAGLYQLGTIKAASLLRCRNPEGYFLQYGSRFTSPVGSLTTGASYGLLCLSCCWGLMIALTAMGTASLVWMAGFAILITLEKLHPAGSTLSRGAGIALLAAAPLILVIPQALRGSMGGGVAVGSLVVGVLLATIPRRGA